MGLTPAFKLLDSSGKEMTELMKRVKQLSATDEAGQKNDELELTLYNDGDIVHPSAKTSVKLFLGYLEEGLYPVGTYVLTNIKYSGDATDELMVLKFMSASSNPALIENKIRSFINKSVGYIVTKIALESSLIPKVDPYFFTLNINKDQNNITNQRLLFDLGQDYDGVTKIQGNSLTFARRGPENLINSEVKLPVRTIKREDIISYNWEEDDKDIGYQSVRCRYRTLIDGKEDIDFVTVGGSDPTKTILEIMPDRESALKRANSATNQVARGNKKLSISTEGKFRVPAETRVNITGMISPIMNGSYMVNKVSYSLDDSDLTVNIEMSTNVPSAKENTTRIKFKDPDDEDAVADVADEDDILLD